ncbi:GPW/gp25 family protein [uncultured Paracoccus sp.]|uniref:GPW/gp25 family protein n=1 Tax=uncultured Paracoccus sp. TaxID=189685 RepID=UPI0025E442BD|nr:GPW/gp25 family protein [uncultured Paracoccus sp.]
MRLAACDPWRMIGMDANTGKTLDGLDHLRQSIRDILTTPIGSRVMRREYGSRLYELVDRPMNGETMAELRMATVEALARWEPRVSITDIDIIANAAGRAELSISGLINDGTDVLTIEGVPVQ